MDLSSRELTTLMLCSFRYAIPRRTGVSHEISNLIGKYLMVIEPWALEQIVRDIEHGIEFYELYKDDIEHWNALHDKIIEGPLKVDPNLIA